MTHTHSLEELTLQNAWLTIGIFDGVHRGHQQILGRLVQGARAAGSPAVVLTFDPHPAVVLGGRADFRCLTTPEERAGLLEGFGVDVVITQTFDRDFANQTAGEFMRRLACALGLRQLIIGFDTALGRNREGDATRLTDIGTGLGYTVEVVPPLADPDGIISSTRIRTVVANGDVSAASAALGGEYRVTGTVVHGDGRGRGLNFPTVNLDLPPAKLIPANGIYATWARVGDEKLASVTSIGVRPTFASAAPHRTVETHILDFERELYGQTVGVEFVKRLRDELKFPSANALVEQIREDVLLTRKVLNNQSRAASAL